MIDTIIALRILWILITPIEETDAFKLGLINADGKTVRKAKTPEEKDATSALKRLVWNLKRLIGIVPGGSTRIGSLAAGYLLMKECVEQGWSAQELEEQFQERYTELCESTQLLESTGTELDALFDTLLLLGEDAPANATGAAVSTDTPVKRIFDKRAVLRRKFTKTLE